MSTLLSCDPGKFHAGLGLFDPGTRRLIACTLLRPYGMPLGAGQVTRSMTHRPDESRAASALALAMRVWLEYSGFKAPSVFVSEYPQVYTDGMRLRKRADPQDLLWLATTVGALASESGAGEVRTAMPREWKGTVPEAIFARRIYDTLAPAERTLYDDMDLGDDVKHNVLEGIGVGLWALGRL